MAVTKKLAKRSGGPASAASTGAVSPCPSPARRIAASSAARSRSATTARIERSPEASPLNTGWNRRAKRPLESAMRPSRSTVAIAIGVFWKNRMKRTSAARCGSIPPSRERLSTSVREAPGVPSAPKATLWNSRAGMVRPPRVLRSISRISVFTSPGTAASVVSSAAPSPAKMSSSLRPPEPTWARSWSSQLASGIEVADMAVGLGREEAGGRVVEVVDRLLQLLEHVLVPLEFARHVGERPHRHARLLFAFTERAHADAQPARRLALVRADAHLLLPAAAFARRLE